MAGKREEAARRVPDAMVTQFGALGTAEMVSERFRLYRDVGIASLTLRLDTDGTKAKLEMLEHILDLLRGLV